MFETERARLKVLKGELIVNQEVVNAMRAEKDKLVKERRDLLIEKAALEAIICA